MYGGQDASGIMKLTLPADMLVGGQKAALRVLAPQTGSSRWFGLYHYLPATELYEAASPTPADGSIDASLTTNINWQPGFDLTSQTVYFGTDPSDLSVVGSGDGTLSTVTNAALGVPLDPLTTYYWKVAGDSQSSSYPVTLWSFTTDPGVLIPGINGWSETTLKYFQILYDSFIGERLMDLARFSRGETEVAWLTQTVPANLDLQGDYTFKWIAGLGFYSEPAAEFQLMLGDIELLNFGVTQSDTTWTSDDVSLTFIAKNIMVQGQDCSGIMELTLPADMLVPGEKATLRVLAPQTGSQRWFGLYHYSSASFNRSDFNTDWTIDAFDLAQLIQVWLSTDTNLPQDLHPDSKIDINDFALFAEDWLGE